MARKPKVCVRCGDLEETLRAQEKMLLARFGVWHRVPLRPNFDVEIRLPRDLTETESEKLSGFLKAIVGPDVGSSLPVEAAQEAIECS